MMFDLQDIAPETVRRISRVEYDRMIELGMFEDEHVELLRGVLVTMTKQSPRHALVSAWFQNALVRALDESVLVVGHSAFAASDDSEPEADVYVTRWTRESFELPDAPLLVIEVADASSQKKDRLIKARIYAESGCPEYWIIDISGFDLVVEVHREPKDGRYRSAEKLRAGDVLRPVALPGVELRVADVLW